MGLITDTLRYLNTPILQRSIDPKDPDGLLTGVRPGSRLVDGDAAKWDEALEIPAVYRAVTLLTTSCKQLPIRLYKNDKRVETKNLPAVLRLPDPFTTFSIFIEGTVAALATRGNAYWQVSREAGVVIGLRLLKNDTVSPKGDAFGNTVGYELDGKKVADPATIYHLKLQRIPGRVLGLGPLETAKKELHGVLATQAAASTFFDKGGIPPGLLTTDATLTPAQADYYKDAWAEKASARNGVAVLGNGLKFSLVGMTAEQAQWIAARHFDVTQVARLFGIDPSLMLAPVEGTNLTYQNVEQAWIAFTRYTVRQYTGEIEDALSYLLPRGQRVQFDFDALLQSDTTTRYAANRTALDAGFMTVDEIREREGLAPLTQAQRDEIAARVNKAQPAATGAAADSKDQTP